MKKVAVVLLICIILLSACSASQGGIGMNGTSIVGKWEINNEYGSAYIYFLENGEVYEMHWDDEIGEITYQEFYKYSYNVNEDKIMIEDDGYNDEFSFNIAGDILIVDEDQEWVRCEVELDQSSVVGTWQLVGTEGDFESFNWNVVNDYIRIFSFYSDGTYKADWGYTHRGEEYIDDPTYGRYEVVNDGRAICFNNIEYYDYELLGYGLLKIVEPSGNVLLYILQ